MIKLKHLGAAVELIVTSVDYAPPELHEQLPFKVNLLRLLPGPDRADYWLGEVLKPLFWINENHRTEIGHVIVCARWQDTQIEPHVTSLPIGIAYVTDPSQVFDETVNFGKCKYVAIGMAHETSGKAPPPPTNKILAGTVAKAFGKGRG
jgi:hypothetical protein